jgi:hypothetical protein
LVLFDLHPPHLFLEKFSKYISLFCSYHDKTFQVHPSALFMSNESDERENPIAARCQWKFMDTTFEYPLESMKIFLSVRDESSNGKG